VEAVWAQTELQALVEELESALFYNGMNGLAG
jgi:hypothetical protein